MTRISLLDSVDLKDRIVGLTQQQLDEATERRSTAFTNVVMTIEDIAENIAEQHRKPVDGLIAEASYLERLDEGLKSNRSEITAGFSSRTTKPDMVQARELDAVRGQLAEAQDANADLQRSAQRVSDLEITNEQLERDKSSLKSQLAASQAETERLKREADKPNPLKQENEQLKADKRRLNGEVAALNEECDQLKVRVTELEREVEEKDSLLLTAERQLDECRHGKAEECTSDDNAGSEASPAQNSSTPNRPSWLRRPERKSRPQSDN